MLIIDNAKPTITPIKAPLPAAFESSGLSSFQTINKIKPTIGNNKPKINHPIELEEDFLATGFVVSKVISSPKFAPQSGQNFVPSGNSLPHFLHYIFFCSPLFYFNRILFYFKIYSHFNIFLAQQGLNYSNETH